MRCGSALAAHGYQLVFIALVLASNLHAGDSGENRLMVEVDWGNDLGQSYGSLWEVRDGQGNLVAGAGFQEAYNTQDRSDRRMLHVFLHDSNPPLEMKTEVLPRPTDDAGTYLYGYQGKLFSFGRNAIDKGLRMWEPTRGQWVDSFQTPPLAVQIGNQPMFATSQQIMHGQSPVLNIPENEFRLGEWYYADGKLIVRCFSSQPENEKNELRAYSWSPGQAAASFDEGTSVALPSWGEFIYCFGQQRSPSKGSLIVAASNRGTVLALHSGQWKVIRESDGRSFQIYSSINLGRRLLFGQYPTGNLFEFADFQLQHLVDSPPVMPGVSSNARELQSLALFGGHLYAGVWPWGEVWRQKKPDAKWELLGRLFTHPEPTDRWTHPYEKETSELDPVLNRWGQRITSMVPVGDSLFISTSAKGPNPYEEKFTFLGENRHLEYGAVHRLTRPGCLTVPVRWSDAPTRFHFIFTQTSIQVQQDGETIGQAHWHAPMPAFPADCELSLGTGCFGEFGGRTIQKVAFHLGEAARKTQGTYVHLHRHLNPEGSPDEHRAALRAECEKMSRVGIDAVMPFATTSSGQAHFDSRLLAKYYTRSDPLAILAQQSRETGLSFHPVLPVLVSGGDVPKGILSQHPEWALRDLSGQAKGYISPANPEARRWLADLIAEIVTNYQPDGLLLDYIRFPNRPHRLDEESEIRFERSLPVGCSEEFKQQAFQQFKEDELTKLVRLLRATVRAAKPEIRLSAYVWGPHVTKNHLIGQVWNRWVEEGLLDHINVSGYCHRETYGDRYLEVFRTRMADSVQLNQEATSPAQLTFALGVKTSHGSIDSAQDIGDYRSIADALSMDGHIFFTWEYLQPYLDELLPRESR
jgi:uncharacterized lipoprotein YddW (UPF0748 family)